MGRSLDLVKNASILWEKKKKEIGISDAEKRDTIGRLSTLHDDHMKEMIPREVFYNSLDDEGNGLSEERKTKREKMSKEMLGDKPYYSRHPPAMNMEEDSMFLSKEENLANKDLPNKFFILNEQGKYLDETMEKIHKNRAKHKEYKKKYTMEHSYDYHMADIVKDHADKIMDIPDGQNLPYPKFNDNGALQAISDNRAAINKAEAGRQLRNKGRIGLGVAGLGALAYGANKLFGNQDRPKSKPALPIA